jgi:MFS family permease
VAGSHAQRLPADTRLLLVSCAIDAFGTGLTLPFLVVYLHQVRGLGLDLVGALVAAPAIMAIMLLVPVGVLVDAVGPRRVQMTALTAAATSAALMAWATTATIALVARGLWGVARAAFGPANQALIAGVVPPSQQQRYFAIAFVLINAGIGVGGMLGALVVDVARPVTFQAIYLADAASFLVPLAALAVPLRHLGGRPARARGHEHETGSYPEVLRDRAFRGVLLLVFVTSFVGYAQVEGGLPAYAIEVARVSARTIGWAFAVNTSVIVLLQLLVLRRTERWRRTRALILMSALWAVSWTVMGGAGLVPGTAPAALLLVAGFGIFAMGETLLSPIMPALTNALAPAPLRGRYTAASWLAFEIAAVAGPVAAGLLIGSGRGAAYLALLLAGCGLAAALALSLERRLPAHVNLAAKDERGRDATAV